MVPITGKFLLSCVILAVLLITTQSELDVHAFYVESDWYETLNGCFVSMAENETISGVRYYSNGNGLRIERTVDEKWKLTNTQTSQLYYEHDSNANSVPENNWTLMSQLIVYSPSASKYLANTVMPIRWLLGDNSNLTIFLIDQETDISVLTITTIVNNTGGYNWTIPVGHSSLTYDNASYYIRVQRDDTNFTDVSTAFHLKEGATNQCQTLLESAVMKPTSLPVTPDTTVQFECTYYAQQTEWIYIVEDLNAIGMLCGSKITAVKFKIADIPAVDMLNFRIGLMHTSDMQFDSTYFTSFPFYQAYSASIPSSTWTLDSWVSIPLTTPFVWNGKDNIRFEQANDNYPSHGAGGMAYYISTDTPRMIHQYGDYPNTGPFPFTGKLFSYGVRLLRIPAIQLEFSYVEGYYCEPAEPPSIIDTLSVNYIAPVYRLGGDLLTHDAYGLYYMTSVSSAHNPGSMEVMYQLSSNVEWTIRRTRSAAKVFVAETVIYQSIGEDLSMDLSILSVSWKQMLADYGIMTPSITTDHFILRLPDSVVLGHEFGFEIEAAPLVVDIDYNISISLYTSNNQLIYTMVDSIPMILGTLNLKLLQCDFGDEHYLEVTGPFFSMTSQLFVPTIDPALVSQLDGPKQFAVSFYDNSNPDNRTEATGLYCVNRTAVNNPDTVYQNSNASVGYIIRSGSSPHASGVFTLSKTDSNSAIVSDSMFTFTESTSSIPTDQHHARVWQQAGTDCLEISICAPAVTHNYSVHNPVPVSWDVLCAGDNFRAIVTLYDGDPRIDGTLLLAFEGNDNTATTYLGPDGLYVGTNFFVQVQHQFLDLVAVVGPFFLQDISLNRTSQSVLFAPDANAVASDSEAFTMFYHDRTLGTSACFRFQHEYLTSELEDMGISRGFAINGVSFEAASQGMENFDLEQVEIRVGFTSVEFQPGDPFWNDLTKVYGPQDLDRDNFPANTPFLFVFDQPITWNGVDNLLVDVQGLYYAPISYRYRTGGNMMREVGTSRVRMRYAKANGDLSNCDSTPSVKSGLVNGIYLHSYNDTFMLPCANTTAQASWTTAYTDLENVAVKVSRSNSFDSEKQSIFGTYVIDDCNGLQGQGRFVNILHPSAYIAPVAGNSTYALWTIVYDGVVLFTNEQSGISMMPPREGWTGVLDQIQVPIILPCPFVLLPFNSDYFLSSSVNNGFDGQTMSNGQDYTLNYISYVLCVSVRVELWLQGSTPRLVNVMTENTLRTGSYAFSLDVEEALMGDIFFLRLYPSTSPDLSADSANFLIAEAPSISVEVGAGVEDLKAGLSYPIAVGYSGFWTTTSSTGLDVQIYILNNNTNEVSQIICASCSSSSRFVLDVSPSLVSSSVTYRLEITSKHACQPGIKGISQVFSVSQQMPRSAEALDLIMLANYPTQEVTYSSRGQLFSNKDNVVRYQGLWLGIELAQAGMLIGQVISGISVDLVSRCEDNFLAFRIGYAWTSDTALIDLTFYHTQVLYGPTTVLSNSLVAPGWNQFVLNSPTSPWDGKNNLIIEIAHEVASSSVSFTGMPYVLIRGNSRTLIGGSTDTSQVYSYSLTADPQDILITMKLSRACSTESGVVCSNHGNCSNGVCICEDAYFGTDCENHCVSESTCFAQGYCLTNGECSCHWGYLGPNCVFLGTQPFKVVPFTEVKKELFGGDPFHTKFPVRTLGTFYTASELVGMGLVIGSRIQDLFLEMLDYSSVQIDQVIVKLALQNSTLASGDCIDDDSYYTIANITIPVLESSLWYRISFDQEIEYRGENIKLFFHSASSLAPPGSLRFYQSSEIQRTCIGTKALSSTLVYTNSYHQVAPGIRFGRYSDPPKILTLSPSSGPADGGTMITITGARLPVSEFDAAEIWVGSNECIDVNTINSTFLTCVTTANPSVDQQSLGISMKTISSGMATSVGLLYFTYVAPPQVLAFEPNSAPISGGTLIRIIGKNLGLAPGDVSYVNIVGVPCKTVSWVSSTRLFCVTSPASVSSGSVEVRTQAGGTTSSSIIFTYATEYDVVVDSMNGNDTLCALSMANPCRTLQGAVNANFNPFTHYILSAGTHTASNVKLKSEGCVIKSSDGAVTTIIQCVEHCFDFSDYAPSLVSNVTITTTAEEGQRRLSAAPLQGGVFILQDTSEDSSLVFDGVTFQGISATQGGIGYISNARVSIYGCSVDSCRATEGAAFFVDGGALTVETTDVQSNTATRGGVVYIGAGTVSMTDSTIEGNTADLGGAIFGPEDVTSITVILQNSDFNANSAQMGAVIYVNKAKITATDSSFTQNAATVSDGGALWARLSDMSLTNSNFTENTASAGTGGAVYAVFAEVDLSLCNFVANEATGGAACHIKSGTQSAISNCTFHRNTAADVAGTTTTGGAISVTDCFHLELLSSSFSNNSANFGGAVAIESSGSLASRIVSCSFSQNEGNLGGGAIYASHSSFSIEDTQLIQNSAESGGGGAIYRDPSSSVTLHPDVLLSGNTASYGADSATECDSLKVTQDGEVAGSISSPILANSNHSIIPPLVVTLLDQYGEVINTDMYKFLAISTGGIDTVGSLTRPIVAGVVDFSGFGIVSPPGYDYSFQIELGISTTQSITQDVHVSLRSCLLTEYESGMTCLPCPKHTIRADGTDPVLSSCLCTQGRRFGNFSEGDLGCEEEHQWRVSSGLMITSVVLEAIALVMCVVLLVGLFMYRNHGIVLASSYMFCNLIVVGCMIALITPILSLLEPTPAICTLSPLLGSTAFALTFGSLFTKNFRLYRIFCNKTLQAVTIRNKDLMKFVLAFWFLELLPNILWFPIDVPSITKVDAIDNFDGMFIKTCSHSVSFKFHAAFYGTKGLALCFGVYLCFQIRNIPKEFNESRWIAAAIYNVTFVGGLCVLLFVFLRSQATAQMAVYAVSMFFLVMSTLSMLFVPKIIAATSDGEAAMTMVDNHTKGRHRHKTSSQLSSNSSNAAGSDTKSSARRKRNRGATQTRSNRMLTSPNRSPVKPKFDTQSVSRDSNDRSRDTVASSIEIQQINHQRTPTATAAANLQAGSEDNELGLAGIADKGPKDAILADVKLENVSDPTES